MIVNKFIEFTYNQTDYHINPKHIISIICSKSAYRREYYIHVTAINFDYQFTFSYNTDEEIPNAKKSMENLLKILKK